MGIITKAQYDRRRENAAQRSIDNEEIAVKAGMTMEQSELISELCSLRHNIHCNVDAMYIASSAESGLWTELDELIGRMYDANLPSIGISSLEDFPCSEDRYIGVIDNTDDAEDENLEEYARMMRELNDKIEDYLRIIDKKYGTSFAPTGALRV